MKRMACFFLALLLLLPAAGLAEGEELSNEKEFVYALLEDGTAEIVGYTGQATVLNIPAVIDGHPVTVIGKRAFYGNQTLTEVTVPKEVTTLRQEAFSFCASLKTLILPDGLTRLERSAIRYCAKLKTVNLPDSVTEAGDLFDGCRVLEKVKVSSKHPYFSVVSGVLFSKPDHRLIWYPMAKKNKKYSIPKGTEIIERYAFHRSALTEVTVPESVKEIRNGAFSNSDKLQKINIPSKVKELQSVFPHCRSLTHISVSAKNPVFESKNGVLFRKAEKELVFYPAGRKDKTYSIPKGTLAIAAAAFTDSQLTGITIPGSVKKIGYNAFLDSHKLKKVTIPEGVEELQSGVFQLCTALTEVSLPRSLTQIGADPFLNCSKLKTVKIAGDHALLKIRDDALIVKEEQVLLWYPQTTETSRYTVPEGVKIIGGHAFASCTQLTEVIIPEGVEEIGEDAFLGCVGVKAFTLPASLKKIGKAAFYQKTGDQLMIDATYTVPAGSYAEEFCEAYKLRTKVE